MALTPQLSEKGGELKTTIIQLLSESGRCSGEELSRRLGISRAAVHKHIEGLRELGYQIDSAPRRGYELVQRSSLNQVELETIVENSPWAIRPRWFESISSTNDIAKQDADECLVVAGRQSAGRGRRGRQWLSEEGGLYMSFGLKPALPPQVIGAVTLAAGLAVARAIGPEAMIKWPNDIQLAGKKVCGILCELITESDWISKLVLGIGLNLVPVAAMSGATSLSEAGLAKTPAQMLEKILDEFYPLYTAFLKQPDLTACIEEINRRSALQGKTVSLSDRAGEYCFEEIASDGQAVLSTASGRFSIGYGEISLRAT